MESNIVHLTTRLETHDFPVLRRTRMALSEFYTRLYPTRLKMLCPPAFGCLFDTTTLELPGLLRFAGVKGLLVFSPNDFAAQLESMVQSQPVVRVHPDIGLLRQRAYFSWAGSSDGNASGLPQTLWVQAGEVQKVLDRNHSTLGERCLPLVFVAGNVVVVDELVQDGALCEKTRSAIDATKVAPTGYSEQERSKAQQKALLYSECPWFLMRYELKNANQRMAVNLAPVCTMNPVP